MAQGWHSDGAVMVHGVHRNLHRDGAVMARGWHRDGAVMLQ